MQMKKLLGTIMLMIILLVLPKVGHANSMEQDVNKTKIQMKKVYMIYSTEASVGRLPYLAQINNEYIKAKTMYQSTRKNILRLKKRRKLLADLDTTYRDYIKKRAVPYINTYRNIVKMENLEKHLDQSILLKKDEQIVLDYYKVKNLTPLDLRKVYGLVEQKLLYARYKKVNLSLKKFEKNILIDSSINQTVKVAIIGNRWIGKSSYMFGGGRTKVQIAAGKFDCSSFVNWAYKQTGRSLGDSVLSTDRLKGIGKKIQAKNIKVGDLVFFDTYKKDGHVAIYVGNRKFIGAQSSTGIAVASMDNVYWKSKFKGHIQRVSKL